MIVSKEEWKEIQAKYHFVCTDCKKELDENMKCECDGVRIREMRLK